MLVTATLVMSTTAACSGDDGQDPGSLGSELGRDRTLKEGDVCDPSMCANAAIACASPDGEEPQVPVNIRCIAGPQVGSGKGVCQLVAECAPASSLTLREGDACPAERCRGESPACAVPAGGSPTTPTNVRCVAGPQTGSGVGVCRLAFDCE
jgi:hypothetical protein